MRCSAVYTWIRTKIKNRIVGKLHTKKWNIFGSILGYKVTNDSEVAE